MGVLHGFLSSIRGLLRIVRTFCAFDVVIVNKNSCPLQITKLYLQIVCKA